MSLLSSCRALVLIENIWIDKFVDLSHKLVIKEIRKISNDILDGSEECDNEDEDENNKFYFRNFCFYVYILYLFY